MTVFFFFYVLLLTKLVSKRGLESLKRLIASSGLRTEQLDLRLNFYFVVAYLCNKNLNIASLASIPYFRDCQVLFQTCATITVLHKGYFSFLLYTVYQITECGANIYYIYTFTHLHIYKNKLYHWKLYNTF